MRGSEGQIDFNDFDLIDFAQILWRRRLLIAACVVIATISSIVYLQSATYKYTAKLKVTPTQSAGLDSRDRLQGIAEIAGLDVSGSDGDAQFELYLEGLKSREIAEQLSRSPYIMHNAFRDAWDVGTGRWKRPGGLLYSTVKGTKSLLGLPVYDWRPPDGAALLSYIESEVDVTDNDNEPVVTISFRHADPRFAAAFLTALNNAADHQLRRRSLRRSTAYIDYLSRQLRTVTLAEHRIAIAENLGEQEKIRMMASANLPFAAEPFGPPSVSSLPDTPRLLMVLAGAFVAGLVAGLLLAFTLAYREYRLALRRRREA